MTRCAARLISTATLFALAGVLSACGSGGGGSGGGGVLPGPGGPSATPTPTPTPTPGPNVKGFVVDDTTGSAISGATVIISENTVIAGATPPPAGSPPWPTATTGPDGSFNVQNVPPSSWTMDFAYVGPGYPIYLTAQWLEIFSPDGHASYHGIWTIATSGTTNLGNLGIALPNSTDNAWLAGINYDRANVGVPHVTTPLIFDSITLQTTRYWANQEAAYGFYGHQCPAADTACTPFWLWETQHHSAPSSQNLALEDPDWQNAEAQFMAEQSVCPDWRTCPYEPAGHYVNLMSAEYWAGVATATGKSPYTQTGTTTRYWAENFTNPKSLSTIQNIRRSLDIK